MSEQEMKESEQLKADIQKEKLNCFDYLEYISRMDERSLTTSGFRGKTNAEAIKMTLDSCTKKIERMIVAFETKFPG